MKRFLKTLLILLILISSFAGTSFAGDDRWVHVGYTTDNEAYFIDTETLLVSGDIITFWHKRYYTKPDSDGASSLFVRCQINVVSRKTRGLSMVAYNKNGDLAYSDNNTTAWMDITPDSIGEVLFNTTLRYAKLSKGVK